MSIRLPINIMNISNTITQNNQLQLLHKRILAINQQYNQRRQQWLRVKYRLKEMANCVIGSGDNQQLGYVNKKQLRRVIRMQQVKSDTVDGQFMNVFNQQYLDNLMLTGKNQLSIISNSSNLQQFIIKNPYDLTSKGNTNNNTQQLIFNNDDSIKLQIMKHKQQNEMLQKQVEMLQKEFDNLCQHVMLRDGQFSDHNRFSQQQHRANKQNLQQYQYQTDQQQQIYQLQDQQNNNNNNHTTATQSQTIIPNTDNQLLSQISCLNKLISIKLSVIKQLNHQNDNIRDRISELKAKQQMLEKKKVFLLMRQKQINKKVDFVNLKDINSVQNNIIFSKLNKQKQLEQNNTNKKSTKKSIIKTTIQSAKQINQLINQNLTKYIKQQKLNEIKQKFNFTL